MCGAANQSGRKKKTNKQNETDTKVTRRPFDPDQPHFPVLPFFKCVYAAKTTRMKALFSAGIAKD